MKMYLSKDLTLFFIQNKKQLYVPCFVLVLSMFFYFFLWDYFAASAFFEFFVNLFRQLTGKLTIFISELLGQKALFDIKTGTIISTEKQVNIVLPTGAYQFYTILLFFYLLVPIKKIKTVFSIILFTVFFISFRASVITTINLFYNHQVHNILLLWIDPLIYIPMLMSVAFIIKENNLLHQLYTRLNGLFKPIVSVSLFSIILLMIFIPPLPRVLLTYLGGNLLDSIVTFTLKGSQAILLWFDYNTEISTKFITFNDSIIQLEYPCLGLGVVTIITIFVMVLKANRVNKIAFLFLFIFLFSFTNSLRLAVTLLYMDKASGGADFDRAQTHDYITYFMYMVAFLSFIVYYFWFQDIVFFKEKNNEALPEIKK